MQSETKKIIKNDDIKNKLTNVLMKNQVFLFMLFDNAEPNDGFIFGICLYYLNIFGLIWKSCKPSSSSYYGWKDSKSLVCCVVGGRLRAVYAGID